MTELQEKKQILAKIRELHKPIRKEEIEQFNNTASERYNEVKSRKSQDNFSYIPPYASPFYKKQIKLLKQEKRMSKSTVMAKHDLFRARVDYTNKIR